jgi:hypothetical protein
MLWAASAPEHFVSNDELARARTNFAVHLTRYAVPALRSWNGIDPNALKKSAR